jgi:thiamine biosynthesis lipoprotein
MGCAAHVVVQGADGLLRQAKARIADLEARWSRFRPTSELSRMNAMAGQPTVVSPELWLLVERAVAAWTLTGGAFDPTVLGAVVAAGYDRDFTELEPGRPAGREADVPGCAGIELDPALRVVTLPAGVGIDPGGIGKGLAADIVVGELLAAGAAGALVSLGGDLRVGGEPPGGDCWTIAVVHPFTGRDLLAIGLTDGAVATSSRLLRRWTVDDGERNHVIEPASGTSAGGPLVAATAVAGEGWWAEALATAALLGRAPVGTGHVLTVSVDGAVVADPELLALAA